MANFIRSLRGERPLLREMEMKESITITGGGMLSALTTGTGEGKLAPHASQTTAPEFVANSDKTSTAEGGEVVECVDIGLNSFEWEFEITPAVNEKTAEAGSDENTVVVDYPVAISADVLIGGKVYCNGEQRTITDNDAVSNPGDNVTLTVNKPFSSSTLGKKVWATPLGLQVKAGQLVASTFDKPSQTISELTGGKFKCLGVDLKRKTVSGVFVA